MKNCSLSCEFDELLDLVVKLIAVASEPRDDVIAHSNGFRIGKLYGGS